MLPLTPWLLAFCMFLFLCLALVKRFTELRARLDSGKGNPGGRGYQLQDLPMLDTLAGSSGYAAVVVLALYINSPVVAERYHYPEVLWFICVLMIYWLSRILILTNRGEMHDDPIVFALKDRTSLLTVAMMGLVVMISGLL